MKNLAYPIATALLATAFFSCAPTNRYIESASLKRLPHGFAPILRNDDEKAGLEIGTGFGFNSTGPLTGTSKEVRVYETEKDESGIDKKVLGYPLGNPFLRRRPPNPPIRGRKRVFDRECDEKPFAFPGICDAGLPLEGRR